MARAVAVLLCLLLALPAAAAQAGGGAASPPWTRTDFAFTSWDGTVLAASKWVPTALCPCPAVIETNGWNNRHDQSDELRFAERYAAQGYYVLGFTSRGWGNSGGQIELDGPKEQNDTKAVVDFLAKQPEVLLDAPGDPRVGMVGESYAGGIQLLTAQQDPRIDSLIPIITWSNLLDSLAPHDVLKVGWVTELYATGQTVGHGVPVPGQHPGDQPNANGPSDQLTQWYAESAAQNGPTADMRTELGVVRSLHPGTLRTPTLLMQGWGDTLFQPNQALATYLDLSARGVPVRLAYFPGGHGISLAETDPASVAADRVRDDWFNVTLRHRAPTLPPYPVLRYRYAQRDYVGELQWPPAGTAPWRGYLDASGLAAAPPTAAVSLQVVNPVGPTTCADVPSFQAQTGSLCPRTAPETSMVLAGPALAADTEVTGTPVAHLQLSSTQLTDVRLFLTLMDVDANGTATPILKQTMPVHLGSGAPAAVDVAMQTVTATLPKGHRVGLQAATTDLGFYASREPGVVTLSSGPGTMSWLDVPIVPTDAWGDHTPPTAAITAAVEARPVLPLGNAPTMRFDGYRLNVTVTDDLAPATPSLNAGDAALATASPGASVRLAGPPQLHGKAVTYSWEFAPSRTADGGSVTFHLRDLVGNAANATWAPPAGWQADACRAGPGPYCLQPAAAPKKSPGLEGGGLLLLLGLAALALRRRATAP